MDALDPAKEKIIREFLAEHPLESERTVKAREAIVNKWCAEQGIKREDLTTDQARTIRALPEWRYAS